jgi:putative ABC transport system permease protein
MTAGVGPSFEAEIPEIESMVRVSNPRETFVSNNEKNYTARSVIYADSAFFKIFSFPLIMGNPNTVLRNPFQAVITKSFATKIFKDINDVVGKTIRLNDKNNLVISGIVEDPPKNSHLRFDLVISFASLYENPQSYLGWNGGWRYLTYLLLYKGSDYKKAESQFVPIAEENINRENREIGTSWNYFLQPLNKVHFSSGLGWDINTRGSKSMLLLFIFVSAIILIIACINFVNLSTVSAINRMKEVGIRKVSGASRRQVISQFLTETMLVTVISLVHALILIELFFLLLSRLIGDEYVLEKFQLYNSSFFHLAGIIIFIILAVGLIAGSYPAWLMSGLKPSVSVKGKFSFGKGTSFVQNILILIQFTIAIIFIVCTLVVASQLNYLVTSDKGFDPVNKLIIPLNTEASMNSFEVLKQEFLSIPGVEKASASSNVPGQDYTRNGYFPEGCEEPRTFHALDVDYNYFETMGIPIAQGRSFSKSFGQDKEAYLINEELARSLGWENPIGKKIRRNGIHTIIGVVKNYNYSPLNSQIEPLIITIQPWRGYDFITLKTNGQNPELMKQLEEKWQAIVPNENFSSFTLISHISQAYTSERGYMYILMFCSFLAVLIASLGLFGLAAFTIRKRNKEMAIRKVYGASIDRIFALVSTGFIKWVVIANLIASPIAYFIMDNYFLVNFAYSTEIKWWVFFLALFFSITISLFVILAQILRLSRLNPIEYIRYE